MSWVQEPIIIGHFSSQPQEGVLPENWEPLEFKGTDIRTVYTHISALFVKKYAHS